MSQCPRCNASFSCAMADPGTASPCWCAGLPRLPAAQLGSEAASCYCPACLQQLLQAAQAVPADPLA